MQYIIDPGVSNQCIFNPMIGWYISAFRGEEKPMC